MSSNRTRQFSVGRGLSLVLASALVLTACERGAAGGPQTGWTPVGRDSVVRETKFAGGPLTNITRCWRRLGAFDCLAVRRGAPPHLSVSRYQTQDLDAATVEKIHFACDLDPAADEWFRQVVYDATVEGQATRISENVVPRMGEKKIWSGPYVKTLLQASGSNSAEYLNCPVLYDFLLRGGVRRLAREDLDPTPLFDDGL